MAIKKTIETVIEEFKTIHGDRYDYTQVRYVNSHTKVKIRCIQHGIYLQQPRAHQAGQGCPKCNQSPRWTSGLKNIKQFIDEAQIIHNGIYDYSLSEYKGCQTKLTILCPQHGAFEQQPLGHLQGRGCPKCAGNIKKDTQQFILEATVVHHDMYQYHDAKYEGANHKITITCKKHGNFRQKPIQHLRGEGCPKCAIDRTKQPKKSTEQFINDAKLAHGNKYDYSKSKYSSAITKTTIICPEHGAFQQRPRDHINDKNGCPQCAKGKNVSAGQSDVARFLKNHVNILECDTTKISPLELDILVPSHDLAIEFHGHYWHSYNHQETPKERLKHYHKYDLAQTAGIHLIQIFDFEWYEKNPIVRSILLSKLKKSRRIYARKCTLGILNSHQARQFFDTNHLQGSRSAKYTYGLIYNKQIICALSLSRHLKYEWEIIRFANALGQTTVGGAGKLLKYFIRTHMPQSILTFADRRYSNGQLYRVLGFDLLAVTNPNYQYILKGRNPRRFSRQQCQKHKLPKLLGDSFDVNLTEAQNMFANGYQRLWDAGNFKFIWHRS